MKNIAVIFGGRSPEHDISIITAHQPIMSTIAAQPDSYNLIPIYISKDGSWHTGEALFDIKVYQQTDFEDWLRNNTEQVNLSFEKGLTFLTKQQFIGLPKKIEIDLVFPALHGSYGEDGSLQGLLRMANVAYVGCGLDASAIAMDKNLTKEVLRANNIEVVDDVYITKKDWETNKKDLLEQIKKLKFPLFTKPVHTGSSIGITKVTNNDDLEPAIKLALHYDDALLVEPAVPNLIEVTVPVMGNTSPRVALVEQTLKGDFFDFEQKYMNQGKSGKNKGDSSKNSNYSTLPADIPKELYKQAEKVSIEAFQAINGSGTARIDLLIDSKKKVVYVNEINCLPGSLYHHNWRAAGVSNIELVNTLIDLGFERHAQEQKIQHVFESSFLKQF